MNSILKWREQYLEVERTVIGRGRGRYKFKEQYAHLEIEEPKWFKMDKQQSVGHLQKVSFQLVSKSKAALLSANVSSLSTDAETVAESVSIPFSVLNCIWKKVRTPLLITRWHFLGSTEW